VDALPNVNNALLLADGWQAGGLHWQIGEGGKLVLGVKAPKGLPPAERGGLGALGKLVRGVKAPPGVPDGHYHAPDVFGPKRFGKWVQLAVVYDSHRRRVTHYVDGRPAARLPVLFDAPLRIEDAEIGNWNPAGNPSAAVRHLDGRMDEFLLFSRALDDQEIGRLYAEGRPPP
jgi:Concanavalin A-like lectin/glucanases superfamily